MRLLSQRQRALSLMTQQAAWACLLAFISYHLQILWNDTGSPCGCLHTHWWEECCAFLVTFRVNSDKAVLCSGEDITSWLQGWLLTNITLKNGPGKDQRQPCFLSIGLLGPTSRLPLPVRSLPLQSLHSEIREFFLVEEFHFRLFYSFWTAVNITLKPTLTCSSFSLFMLSAVRSFHHCLNRLWEVSGTSQTCRHPSKLLA